MTMEHKFRLLTWHFGKQVEIAKLLGVHRQAISQWKSQGYIPADKCIQIERLTNGELKAVDLYKEEV